MKNYFTDILICKILKNIKMIVLLFDNIVGVSKIRINIFIPGIKDSRINNYHGVKFSILIGKNSLHY